MNELMTNYKNYAESLENTPEPVPVKDMPVIDYKSLIAYHGRKESKYTNSLPMSKSSLFLSTNLLL